MSRNKSEDPTLESGILRDRYVGIPALNPFVGCLSTSRIAMMVPQISQKNVIAHPEPKIIQTPLDVDLKKHTFSIKAPCRLRVTSIIQNLSGATRESMLEGSISGEVKLEYMLVYVDLGTGQIGGLEVPRTHSLDPRLGFTYYQVREVKVGDILEKDEVIADSIGALQDTYNFSANINVAFCSHHATAEDALLFNSATLWKYGYNTITKYVIKVSENEALLDIWGKDGSVRTVPMLGQSLGPGGIIVAKRKFDEDNFISSGSPSQMKVIDHLNDQVYQGSVDGSTEIIAVKVLKHRNKQVNPNNVYEVQLNALASETSKYAGNVVDGYMRARAAQRRSGKSGQPTNEFNSRILRDLVQNGSETLDIVPPKLTDKKAEIPAYTLEITVRETRLPDMGAKFTDLCASKGVISKIVAPEFMPRDHYGRIADVCKSNDSIASRNIPGEVHDQYIGNCSDLLHREFHKRFGTWTEEDQFADRAKSSVRRMRRTLKAFITSQEGIDAFVESIQDLVDFYHVIYAGRYPVPLESFLSDYLSNPGGAILNDLVEYMLEVLVNRVPVPLTVTIVSELGAANIILALSESRFAPEVKPVSYVNRHGNVEYTVDPVMVAPMAVTALEKDGSEASASFSVQLQSMRMASTGTKLDKQLSPLSKSNISLLALDNTVILSAVIGEYALGELLDLCNNVASRKARVSAIMNSENPLGEKNLIDRAVVPYGTTSLSQLRHTMASFGAELHYVDESE